MPEMGGRRAPRRPTRGRLGPGAALVAALVGVLLAATAAEAQTWREFRAARQAAAIDALELSVIYGAGQVRIGPAGAGWLYDIQMRYDASRFTPSRSWSLADGVGRLQVHLSSADEGNGRPVRLDDLDIDLDMELDDLKRLGDASGRLDLGLGDRVPTDLTVAIGAAESTLELGGIPLTGVEISTGASDTRLSFDRPNPQRMESLVLRSGAASFRATRLGNARFERLEYSGGVGDVVLDFGGEWDRDARASVRMGLGSMRVRLPAELGVRIEKKSFLASFTAPDFRDVGGAWVSENWDEAPVKLVLELDAAFGSIDVERLP